MLLTTHNSQYLGKAQAERQAALQSPAGKEVFFLGLFQAPLRAPLGAPMGFQAVRYLQAPTQQHLQRPVENPDPLQGKSRE